MWPCTCWKSCREKGGSLTQPVHIPAEELLPDTYSPMRDAHKGQSVTLPLREVLRYMIAESDNNACDILIARFGGWNRSGNGAGSGRRASGTAQD